MLLALIWCGCGRPANEVAADLVKSGELKRAANDPAGAAADFTQAIAADPKSAAAYYDRGMLRAQQQDWDGAGADFTHVVELQPDNAKAFSLRGAARQNKGDLPGALADYSKVIELKADSATVRRLRAEAREASGDWDGAIADLERAASLDPKVVSPAEVLKLYAERAKALIAAGDLDGAMAIYAKAGGPGALPDLIITLSQALAQRGDQRRLGGNPTGAISDFSKSLAIFPEEWTAYSLRAETKRAQGDDAGAIEDYTVVLEHDPGSIIYNNRALAEMSLNDFPAALTDLNQALTLNGTYTGALENRSNAKRATGDLAGALEDAERVQALNSSRPGGYLYRNIVRQMQGDFAGALADCNRYLELDAAGAYDARFYVYLLSRRLGRDPMAAGLAQSVPTWKDGWRKTIGRYLLGEVKEADLFTAAGQFDLHPVPEQQSEAYYFAGMVHLLDNDPQAAKDLLAKAVATGAKDSPTYSLAEAELGRLDKKE